MGIIEFLGLGEQQQWEYFWDHCSFVEHYVDIEHKYHLYALHNFYVELTSDVDERLNKHMNVFESGPRLEKYLLGGVDVSKLLENGQGGEP